jgi:DNA-binding response OmpR family regulator
VPKILLVEDDQLVANIYRNKFAVEGFEVEAALDGLAGLELVRNFRPELVILDLMLPKLSGVELLKKIRGEPEFKKLPVVVFSNTYLSNMVQEAWRAGATKCLSKANCTPRQLLEVVRSLLPASCPPAPAPAVPPSAQAKPPTPRPQPAPASSPLTSSVADEAFQADLRKTFVGGLPATLATLRKLLQAAVKAENDAARLKQVDELYRSIRSLTANAGMTGLLQIARMSDALEALLRELHEKPDKVNASTLRTVASAVDFLGILFEQGLGPEKPNAPSPKILVVDDEAISCRAVTYALGKAKLKCVTVEEPAAAYDMLPRTAFDLVILDVDMPEMNGFELCTRLRMLPAHKKTPVIFVTGLNDFESRANSTVSGGNDFIAKPFLFMELAVKALVYVLRGRIQPAM